MTDMTAEKVNELRALANQYLEQTGGGTILGTAGSGGSAVVFFADRGGNRVAVKVYDPKFLGGLSGVAELHRLGLQRALIGHSCKNLVAMNRVEEQFGTAFVEMEYLNWADLKAVLTDVPDECVQVLVQQLVVAVKFLESHGVVHRDIKPENIKISSDFLTLKLLDLGVVREVQRDDEYGFDATDHGHVKPFLATAQYSSPEYLFRLVEPSAKLWKALSLYQVGAVLHDLIKKQALYQEEVDSGNKFKVAHAVLNRVPTFPDADSSRLAQLKSLSNSCLVKDMDLRLALVDWSNFEAVEPNAVLALREQLKRRKLGAGEVSERVAKLRFEQGECVRRLREATRAALIEVCGLEIPVSVRRNDGPVGFEVRCQITQRVELDFLVFFKWPQSLDGAPATVFLENRLNMTGTRIEINSDGSPIGVAHAQGDGEDQLVVEIVNAISGNLTKALQLQEGGDSCLEAMTGKAVSATNK